MELKHTTMIYHVLTEAEPFSEHAGGAISRWVANVIRDDGESRVVCPASDGSWNFDPTRICRIPMLDAYHRVLRVSRGRFPSRFRDFALRAVFAQFSAILKPQDVVYVHNRPEFIPVLRALTAASTKLVLHMHNSHLATYSYCVANAAKADLTVFCSRFLESEALSRLPQLWPTVVIANGADMRLFYPSQFASSYDNPEPPVVLFVGRLVPEKGAHVLIDALRILEQRGIQVTGRIVGSAKFGSNASTAYTEELRRRAPANVEFVPYTSGAALAGEFRGATIFCCPSVWNEAFGMVNVEAMASRLPVVATNVGGITETFSTGGALLVRPGDAVEMADALAALATDRSLRENIAAAGMVAFLARFEWNVIRARYREVIAQLGSATWNSVA